MPTKVNFPKSGMGISDGKVARWLKAVGDRVQAGEPLVEMETEKAIQEVEAPVSGTLIQIIAAEGETAEVNTPLGMIEETRE